MGSYEKLRNPDQFDLEGRQDVHASDLEQSEGMLRAQLQPRFMERRTPRSLAWFLHTGAAAVNLLLFLIFMGYLHPQQTPTLAAPYSPAESAISYENTAFNLSLYQENKYNGDPRPEQAQAWETLMGHMGLWATDEEMRKLNRTSIKVPGQGNLIELEMFHQLHCLDYIRQHIYRDAYPTNEGDATVRVHVSHCIDALRQAIQCQGNTAIVTYSWRPDYSRPWPDFQINKQCRDYEALKDWAVSRKVTKDFEKNPIFNEDFAGRPAPVAIPNTTELVSGTRLNPKLMEELKSSQANIY